MKKLSTENLFVFPKPHELKNICKSISVLEAIICPEWEYRYYSYQKKWSTTEEVCEMKNGSGDQMLIIFSNYGTCINGFAHESILNGWEKDTQKIENGILDKLPNQFNEFIFGEPVKSIGTTFCIWNTNSDINWEIGDVELPKDKYKDGSEDLLNLLDGKPETYKNWAEEYYEEEFEEFELKIDLVKDIFEGTIITKKMANDLNPDLTDFDQLKDDLEEIGYGYDF